MFAVYELASAVGWLGLNPFCVVPGGRTSESPFRVWNEPHASYGIGV